MLISKLHNYLIAFSQSDNPFRTMLIDGKWGCGKTFCVNQFVETHFKANHIYLSLFGIKRKEDIVIRLYESLGSSYIVNFDGEYSLKSPLTEQKYNGVLIIFDDLERTDSGLSFASIYGIVDSLRNLGFKILCVCNSISIDNKKDFNDFKEKAFDLVTNVEADASQFSQVTGVSFGFESALLTSVNDNWRIIKRAVYIYRDILKTAESNNIDNLLQALDLDESAFFRCVVLAAFCFFGEKQEVPTFEKNAFGKAEHEYDTNELGKIVGNNFYLLFTRREENSAYKESVRIILKSLVYSDGYKGFLEKAKPSVKNSKLEEHPFDKELFFLDDKGHMEYKKAFFKSLNTFDFSDRQQQRIVNSVISNCLDELTKEEMNRIIRRIVDTVPINESSDCIETMVLSNSDRNPKFNTFINDLKKEFNNKSNSESKKTIDDLMSRRDFRELTNYLYENKYALSDKKEAILLVLKENNFFLPDLSKEVDYSSWGYCHESARFVAGTEYEGFYIDSLKKQCEKSSSIELRKKCNALVKYNFHIEMDFFDLFPINSR